MPSVFKRLRRGVKLLAEHLYDPITTALNLLTQSGVTKDELEKPYGSFRINFYLPVYTRLADTVGSYTLPYPDFITGNKPGNTATMPFLLPPLQEYVDSVLEADTSTRPEFILDEVSISHDQRAEPRNVRDFFSTNTGTFIAPGAVGGESAEGELNSEMSSFGYRLLILAKPIDGTRTAPTRFGSIVYQLDIPDSALNQSVLRLNPYVQSNINITMDPNKAYLAQIVSTKNSNGNRGAFTSLMTSLKFKHRMVPRDSGATIQNIPSHNGTFAPVHQTITKPTADSSIDAIGATGVNTMLDKPDSIFRSKLYGGYTKRSEINYAENIKDSACYEVIMVNLFNGFYCIRGGSSHVVGEMIAHLPNCLPYINSITSTSETLDRRIIPLQYPMTIHGVFAFANYGTNVYQDSGALGTSQGPAKYPTSTTFYNEVGVGLMSGIRSDTYTYQQVAYASWDPVTLLPRYRVDNAAENWSSGQAANLNGYMYETILVPLMGANGTPFLPNSTYTSAGGTYGKPIFGGQTNSDLASRSNMQSTGSPALTAGQEQAIEIRWAMKDTGANGMSDATRWANQETVSGQGGHWVMIYGKKHIL